MATALTAASDSGRPFAASPTATRSGRWFYAGLACAIVVAETVGFAHSGARRMAARVELSPTATFHAVLFSTWIMLYFVQTLLVAARRVWLHRWLGLAAAVLAGVMIVTAPPLAVDLARRNVLPNPLFQLMLMLGDMACFAPFVTLGVLLRRQPEAHKRLMSLATVSLLPPGVGRWPIAVANPAPVVSVALVVFTASLAVHDRLTLGRIHRVTLWGGLAIMLSVPVRVLLAQTPLWHRFGAWLIR